MNNEERVELVFETISKIAGFEIKPNKDFYIRANGEEIRHHISKNLTLMQHKSKEHYERSDYTILPILKGGYKLIEIKGILACEEKELVKKEHKQWGTRRKKYAPKYCGYYAYAKEEIK